MLDHETNDYDSFVASFKEAWKKYLDPNKPGERVNSYYLETIDALCKVFWDKQKNMPTPLSDDVIAAATSIISRVNVNDFDYC
jgi:hypothetical protein